MVGLSQTEFGWYFAASDTLYDRQQRTRPNDAHAVAWAVWGVLETLMDTYRQGFGIRNDLDIG